MPRYRADHEIPLQIRRGAGPVPAQLVDQLRDLVSSGALRPGDPVPSSRALATRLGISRGSVTTAYDQLAGEGYLVADRGSTRITPGLPDAQGAPPPAPRPPMVPAPAPDEPRTIRHDLRPNAPSTSALATTAWRAAWRAAAADPSPGHPPQGSPALREQLAEHLRQTRHVPSHPSELLVTAGARHGLQVLLAALARRKAAQGCAELVVAVEDPGYPSLHRVPQALGHRIVPVPLDAQGMDPHRLPTGPGQPDLVLLTPSHQHPMGTSMPVARRLELLQWAEEHQALLVEDDYDSELRYVGEPLPALAALDAGPAGPLGRVATLGSFAKTTTPGLGLGFLRLPGPLTEELPGLVEDAGGRVSGVVQDAMAHFMASGGLRRHVARMRRDYRRRRDLVARTLGPEEMPEGVAVRPMEGGLHAVLELPSARDERSVRDAVARAGIAVSALGDYWRHERAGAGLVLGIGALDEPALERALLALRAAVAEGLDPSVD